MRSILRGRALRISVIVLAHNCEHTIAQCLESLLRQSAWSKFEREIIVVANGCSDGTEAVAKRYPVQLISHPTPLGHAGAGNMGYSKSSGDIVFPAFGDAYYAEDYIELCVRHLLNDPATGSAYGFDLQWPGDGLLSKFLDEDKRLRKIKYKPFSGWFFRREDLRKLGLENELYDTKIVGPDIKLADQIKSLGYKLAWEPQARYWHGKDYNSLQKVFTKGFNLGSKLFQQLWSPSGNMTFKNVYWFNRRFYHRIGLVLLYLSLLVIYVPYSISSLPPPLYLTGLVTIVALPYAGFTLMALQEVLRKQQHVTSFKSYVTLLGVIQTIRYLGMTVGFLSAAMTPRKHIPY
jgi:glycosyltransferase involved in cell wall biosynthesis